MNLWNDLQEWCEDYGFELTEENGEYVIWGKETVDGNSVEWIWYDPVADTVQTTDTDKNNMWLYEGRPDLSADDIVEMAKKLADILDWPDMSIADIVDPEDWQEIAQVNDAYADSRFALSISNLA